MESGKFQFGFTVFAVALLCAAFLALGRQVGFSDGARETTDQILLQQTQSSEVIELRARLDEQRRAEDRVSTVVMTAFGAAISVLVLVNAGLVIGSVLNFQREKDALRDEFILKAKELDAELARQLVGEVRATEMKIQSLTEGQFRNINDRVGNLESRLDSIVDSVDRARSSIDHLSANTSFELGEKEEKVGLFADAAISFARAATLALGAGHMDNVVASLARTDKCLNTLVGNGESLSGDRVADIERRLGIIESDARSQDPKSDLPAAVATVRESIARLSLLEGDAAAVDDALP